MAPQKKNMNVEEKTFKFSWAQIFSNANGKTSATALVGFISSMVCLILFCVLTAFYFFNVAEAATVMAIIDKTITYFSISAGLLGLRSISSTLANGDRIKIGENNQEHPQYHQHQYQQYPIYGSSPVEQSFDSATDLEETNDATTGLDDYGDMPIPNED